MGEYIKRDRLLRDPYFQKDRFPESHLLRMAIMNQPAADVVEVKRGCWVGTADGYADGKLVYDMWECSECGYDADGADEKPNWNFCPNCGAKMDGGENHESN